MAKRNTHELFGKNESTIEKLGNEIEALTTDQELLHVVKTKPKAIKRSKQRNAVALAASSQVFNLAVMHLQGLGFLPPDMPHELLIKKILNLTM